MKKLMLLVAACLMLGACTTINHNVANQLDATNVDFTTMKKGRDCQYTILGLIPLSTHDIDEAAKEARIHRLKYVEHSFSNYLIFTERCVVVYGL